MEKTQHIQVIEWTWTEVKLMILLSNSLVHLLWEWKYSRISNSISWWFPRQAFGIAWPSIHSILTWPTLSRKSRVCAPFSKGLCSCLLGPFLVAWSYRDNLGPKKNEKLRVERSGRKRPERSWPLKRFGHLWSHVWFHPVAPSDFSKRSICFPSCRRSISL